MQDQSELPPEREAVLEARDESVHDLSVLRPRAVACEEGVLLEVLEDDVQEALDRRELASQSARHQLQFELRNGQTCCLRL